MPLFLTYYSQTTVGHVPLGRGRLVCLRERLRDGPELADAGICGHMRPLEGTIMDQQSEQQVEETPQEQPAPLEPEIEGRHWYAIHTYSGYENKVKQHIDARIISMNLKDRIFRVLVPTEDVVE